MRIEATAASVSWIPSESVAGALRRGFDVGLAHYDPPPPDVLDDDEHLHRLCHADRFRFANLVRGWAEVEDGRVVDAGFADGSGLVMGSTTVRVGGIGATFRAMSLPVIAAAPERIVWGSDWPHVMVQATMPNDGDLLDALAEWAPDPVDRHRILVDNPARLYGF